MNFLPWPQTKKEVPVGNVVTLATLSAGEWERGRREAGRRGAAAGAGQELKGKFPLQMGSDSLLPPGQSEGEFSHCRMEAGLRGKSCLSSSL